jgi:hypothetical protein
MHSLSCWSTTVEAQASALEAKFAALRICPACGDQLPTLAPLGSVHEACLAWLVLAPEDRLGRLHSLDSFLPREQGTWFGRSRTT